jgi:hypothetical protein
MASKIYEIHLGVATRVSYDTKPTEDVEGQYIFAEQKPSAKRASWHIA